MTIGRDVALLHEQRVVRTRQRELVAAIGTVDDEGAHRLQSAQRPGDEWHQRRVGHAEQLAPDAGGRARAARGG